MIYDMVKSGDIPSSRAMSIITANLEFETAEDILTVVLQQIVPALTGRYLPLSRCDETERRMFDVCARLLSSGSFDVESTLQLFVTCMIGFASSDEQLAQIKKWYFDAEGNITDAQGQRVNDMSLTLKQRHSICKKIWSPTATSKEEKDSAM